VAQLHWSRQIFYKNKNDKASGPIFDTVLRRASMQIFLPKKEELQFSEVDNNLSILVNHSRSFNICNSLVTKLKKSCDNAGTDIKINLWLDNKISFPYRLAYIEGKRKGNKLLTRVKET
jgi:hypothetical protein